MKRLLSLAVMAASLGAFAQDRNQDFSAYRDSLMGNYQGFRTDIKNNYEKFREEINANYAKFLRGEWVETRSEKRKRAPKGYTVPVRPVVLDEPDPEIESPKIAPVEIPKGEKRRPYRHGDPTAPDHDPTVPIEGVKADPIVVSPSPLPRATITPMDLPKPKPQPMPQVAIQVDKPKPSAHVNAYVYGTSIALSKANLNGIRLAGIDNASIADAWESLASGGQLDHTLAECLAYRDSHKYNDWAYLNMLAAVGKALAPGNENLQTLIQAYLYTNSGYKMRLARTGQKLTLLYASEHQIYNTPYYLQDNISYYPFNSTEGSAQICEAEFPNERPLSLLIDSNPQMAANSSEPRALRSRRGVAAESSVNENLIAFYNNYPSSSLNYDMLSRWVMYCNTPLCPEAKEMLYPTLQAALDERQGLYQKVDLLLNFVQTAFTYKYDEEVWGADRPFFPDEVLFYPYADCEDRTSLFTRLVRDLVGLECAIVYYPGHLASAVHFPDSEQIQGDKISLNGRDFLICDPTYIGARAGRTMPGMDNTKAQAAILP